MKRAGARYDFYTAYKDFEVNVHETYFMVDFIRTLTDEDKDVFFTELVDAYELSSGDEYYSDTRCCELQVFESYNKPPKEDEKM